MILLIVNAFKLMGSHFKHIQACSGIIQTYIPVDWQLVVRETQLLIKEQVPFQYLSFFTLLSFCFYYHTNLMIKVTGIAKLEAIDCKYGAVLFPLAA